MLDLLQAARAAKGLPAADTVSRLMGRKSAEPVVYGWHVDPSVSDPANAVTYLAHAVGKTPAAMRSGRFSYGSWKNAFFMPRPCMLRYDGTVAYYLDPNDYTKKIDGTPSDVADAEFAGNAMMEWPLIWYKFTAGNAPGEGSFYVSDRQMDSGYKCWCNIDAGGEVIPHFYTAIYNGTGTASLRSVSGVALSALNGANSMTYGEALTKAQANDPVGSTIWGLDLYSDWQLIAALLVLMGKSLDTQAVFGKGLAVTSEETAAACVTGSMNDKGMFFGDTTSTDSMVKVFGMENRWGVSYRHLSGITTAAESPYARVKLTYGRSDGSLISGFDDPLPSLYVDSGVSMPSIDYQSDAFITKMDFGGFGMIPSQTNGSSVTYYCDRLSYWGHESPGLYIIGGTNGNFEGRNGAFALDEINSSTRAWTIGAALSCKPTAI